MPSKDRSNGALVTHCLACSITVCIYFEAFTLRFDVTYRHLAEYGVVFNIKLTVCKYMNLNCRNEHCETNVQYFEIKVDHFLLNPLSFNKEIVCWWFIDISWSIQKEWIYCVCNILELLSFSILFDIAISVQRAYEFNVGINSLCRMLKIFWSLRHLGDLIAIK